MKHYFISVKTGPLVNKMGAELGTYAKEKYDRVVVSEDGFEDVNIDLLEKKAELEMKYPNSKPFCYITREYQARYGCSGERIRVAAENTGKGRYIFSMETIAIRNEVEVKKGGAA